MIKSIKNTNDIGQCINIARKRAKLTQHDAAALCGVSIPFFNAIENGKTTAQIGKVLHVCQQLGIQFQVTLLDAD